MIIPVTCQVTQLKLGSTDNRLIVFLSYALQLLLRTNSQAECVFIFSEKGKPSLKTYCYFHNHRFSFLYGKLKFRENPQNKQSFQTRNNAFFLIYSNSLQEVNTKRLKNKTKQNSHCSMYIT